MIVYVDAVVRDVASQEESLLAGAFLFPLGAPASSRSVSTVMDRWLLQGVPHPLPLWYKPLWLLRIICFFIININKW